MGALLAPKLQRCAVLALRGNAFSKTPEIFGKGNTGFVLGFFFGVSVKFRYQTWLLLFNNDNSNNFSDVKVIQ